MSLIAAWVRWRVYTVTPIAVYQLNSVVIFNENTWLINGNTPALTAGWCNGNAVLRRCTISNRGQVTGQPVDSVASLRSPCESRNSNLQTGHDRVLLNRHI
jgi:sucrose-6-phosphate hydrolase SacC (GH32 family)